MALLIDGTALEMDKKQGERGDTQQRTEPLHLGRPLYQLS